MFHFSDTPWKVVSGIQGWGLFVNKEDGFIEGELTNNSKTAHPGVFYSVYPQVERVLQIGGICSASHHNSPRKQFECTRGLHALLSWKV